MTEITIGYDRPQRRMRAVTVFAAVVVMGANGGAARSAPTLSQEVPPRRVSVLVHVESEVPFHEAVVSATRLGISVGTRYPMIGVFVAYGDRAVISSVEEADWVDHLEANARVTFSTDTSHLATRSADLLEGSVRMGGKRKTVDGEGVGVAIVDTGVDGTHPDLAPQMGGNVRIICTGPGTVTGTITECKGPKHVVELEDTDTPGAGGHGTHVSGIVAGGGDTYHGAAPGATLYGVGIGSVTLVENALDGLRWVLENHNKVSPPIRVVNNSWGSPYANPNDPLGVAVTKMVDLLVDEGVTVVFAAGNSGGTGSTPTTSLECVNPTPGVICVANYDDLNMGSREGTINPSSSRGSVNDPATWPDISAPGTNIISTCRVTLPVCVAYGGTKSTNPYGSMSGTSMAAPHVTGIVAQLLQMAPKLTPAQIEDVIEDSALPFNYPNGGEYESDQTNKGTRSSFDKGHGLIDALAALRLALTR